MKRLIFMMTVLALVSIAGAAWALEFSADMVNTAEGRSFAGKIFVSNEKIRMEMAGATTITRMDKKVVWVIMPEQKMYMEQTFDPEKAAGATEKMPGEIKRKLIGQDNVSGRAASKYRVVYTSKVGEAAVLQWVDKASGIPVKTTSEDGSWAEEYRNLSVGAQDASLFEVPPGLRSSPCRIWLMSCNLPGEPAVDEE